MSSMQILGWSLLTLVLGAFVSLVCSKARRVVGYIAFVFVLLAAIGIFMVSANVFLHGPITTEQSLFNVPGIGANLLVKVDYLSALFLAIIALISILTTLYSIHFMVMPYFEGLSLAGFYPLLLIFFAAVMSVVCMADMFFFFICWELMTLASYTLVVFDKKRKERLRAGFKYFLMTHIATAFMFIAAILLYVYGKSFAFDAFAATFKALTITHPLLVHVILAFFFIGFATKAGILPFGDWLPDAYPAAPSPATSAFAGSMTNLGVYGMIRIFADILPISSYSQAWGLIIAIFGTISIFVGTMTSLAQDDTKRLLSFNVIGQMGYILLGIGTGIFFLPSNPALATIGIMAGVFHLLNGICYKSCLFLNAGSIFYKVGTRDLNLVGGLYKLMPVTAITTVIASLSISGIPPFNGFASKWLIYQATIAGGVVKQPLFIALGIIGIFVSTLTLAALVKFLSTAFFGKLHTPNPKVKIGDVPLEMQLPQSILAVLSILFGIVPMLPIKYIYSAISGLFDPGFSPALASICGSSAVGISLSFGEKVVAGWNPVIVVIVTLICLVIAYLIFKAGGASVRTDATWYCGELHADEEVHYKAHSFYLTFKQFFRIRIGKYEREGVYPTVKYPTIQPSENWLSRRILDIDKWFYYPFVNGFMKVIGKFSTTHVGIPHVYLLWLVIGVGLAITILFVL